jgi:pilus biogenesis lipoprotein CpaD
MIKPLMTRVSKKKPILFILFGLSLLTAGCTRQQGVLPNYQEDDLRERHLIKQQSMLEKLSVIPVGPKQDRINPYDIERITSFVQNYKLSGLDHLTITYVGSRSAEPAITALLKSLDETDSTTKSIGAQGRKIEILFSYTTIQAALDRSCEGRRTDGGITLMVPNKTMGCAYSVALAQQIDQPRDLVEPRQRDKKYYQSTSTSSPATATTSSTSDSAGGSPLNALKSLLNQN